MAARDVQLVFLGLIIGAAVLVPSFFLSARLTLDGPRTPISAIAALLIPSALLLYVGMMMRRMPRGRFVAIGLLIFGGLCLLATAYCGLIHLRLARAL